MAKFTTNTSSAPEKFLKNFFCGSEGLPKVWREELIMILPQSDSHFYSSPCQMRFLLGADKDNFLQLIQRKATLKVSDFDYSILYTVLSKGRLPLQNKWFFLKFQTAFGSPPLFPPSFLEKMLQISWDTILTVVPFPNSFVFVGTGEYALCNVVHGTL